MPVLRPSGSDYTAVVKAAAQYVKPGTTAKQSKSGSGMMLAPPSLGAVARASYVGARSSPASSVIQLFGPVATSGPPPIVDWANALAVVTTLAGDGTADFLNGTGTGARFNQPSGVAVLPNGNTVVADTFNHCIRMITPAGVVTTLAGNGTYDFVDGTGAAARFSFPYGLATLANGNIVVADNNNNRIRLITMPGAVVTTLAGDGNGDFLNGTGTGARFNGPISVAVLPNGNIAVADSVNHRIRLVTPAGVVTTLAGSGSPTFADGTGAGASFKYPYGVAALSNGNVVVADHFNHRIRLITPAGVVTTIAGDGTAGLVNGTGTGARFTYPSGAVELPNGNIVVADNANCSVRLITMPGAVVTTLAGTNTSSFLDATGTAARFFSPWGVAVFPNGTLVLGDFYGHRIRLITPT